MYEQTIPLPRTLIFVKSIYSPDERAQISAKLSAIREHLKVGMTRFHAEVTSTVDANNHRIQKPDGTIGLFTGQLSERNMRHFEAGVRSADTRLQIFHAYIEISQEMKKAA